MTPKMESVTLIPFQFYVCVPRLESSLGSEEGAKPELKGDSGVGVDWRREFGGFEVRWGPSKRQVIRLISP